MRAKGAVSLSHRERPLRGELLACPGSPLRGGRDRRVPGAPGKEERALAGAAAGDADRDRGAARGRAPRTTLARGAPAANCRIGRGAPASVSALGATAPLFAVAGGGGLRRLALFRRGVAAVVFGRRRRRGAGLLVLLRAAGRSLAGGSPEAPLAAARMLITWAKSRSVKSRALFFKRDLRFSAFFKSLATSRRWVRNAFC